MNEAKEEASCLEQKFPLKFLIFPYEKLLNVCDFNFSYSLQPANTEVTLLAMIITSD